MPKYRKRKQSKQRETMDRGSLLSWNIIVPGKSFTSEILEVKENEVTGYSVVWKL